MSKKTTDKPKKKTQRAGSMRSWRDLSKSSGKHTVTPEARRRRFILWMRGLGISAVVLGVSALVAAAIYYQQTDPSVLRLTGPGPKLEKIHFQSDGVLNRDWLDQTLDLEKGTALMDVDIFAIDDALEAEGQVRLASVQRSFPDGLMIEVKEHQPVMRLVTEDAKGNRRALLVAQTGEIFEGRNYPRETLRHLPYAAGVKVHRQGEQGFAPLNGIPVVADLLDTARTQTPELYRDWKIVSLERYDPRTDMPTPWSIIEVKTRQHGTLVFAPGDFERQVSRLAQVVAEMRQDGVTDIERIDLSLVGEASVKVASEPRRRAYPHRR